MSQGTGPEREDEDIVLPSWIDAAISRTRSTGEPLESPDAQALPEEAVEPMADEVPFDEMPTAEYPRPVPPLPIASAPSTEPFPTFLDRRESMEYANEQAADPPCEDIDTMQTQEMVRPQPTLEEFPPQPMQPLAQETRQPNAVDFLQRRVAEEFDAQRAAIVSEAMAEDRVPGSEPIPLPVAPPRRRAPSGPWLMAALFFAAAALVLAVLIWLRPLPH